MMENNRTNEQASTSTRKNIARDPVEVIGDRMLREVAAILAKPESNSTAQAV